MKKTRRRSVEQELPRQPEMPSYDLREYITTRQAADLLGLVVTSVNHLLYDGKLQGIKIGRDWFIYRPSIENYLKIRSPKGRPSSKRPKLP
jgi:excisionase family DNA binding protein